MGLKEQLLHVKEMHSNGSSFSDIKKAHPNLSLSTIRITKNIMFSAKTMSETNTPEYMKEKKIANQNLKPKKTVNKRTKGGNN